MNTRSVQWTSITYYTILVDLAARYATRLSNSHSTVITNLYAFTVPGTTKEGKEGREAAVSSSGLHAQIQ